MYSSM